MTLTRAIKTRIEQVLAEKGFQLYTATRIGGVSANTIKTLIAERNKSVNLKTVLQIIRSLEITAGEFFSSPLFESYDLEID